MDREKTVFEKKIKPILQYIGAIGAVLMSIMYIVCVVILIVGFKAQTILNVTIFAIVNALVGLIIMQFLKIQGISFAKELPQNEEIEKEYYSTKTKDKKNHSFLFVLYIILPKDRNVKCENCKKFWSFL